MTLLLEPRSQEKQKTPAPSKGASWQRRGAREQTRKRKTGKPQACSQEHLHHLPLYKKEKKKKIELNTVCMNPRDLTKTWEGCVSFSFLGTLSACLFFPPV